MSPVTPTPWQGDSYRLREKRKAGLLARKPKPAEPEEVGVPAGYRGNPTVGIFGVRPAS